MWIKCETSRGRHSFRPGFYRSKCRKAGNTRMTYIMVDIEADGPIPGDYSMVCFGAVVVEPSLSKIFYGQLKPMSSQWIPEALAVSGFTRDETLQFEPPRRVMERFDGWLENNSHGRPIFVS